MEAVTPKRPGRRVQGPPGVQCPSCRKLAGLEEPEVEDSGIDVSDTEATITVTLVRNSTCCGDEIKRADLEATIDLSGQHECPNADIVGRTVYINGSQEEIVEGFEGETEPELEPYISGGGRYAASYVGATGSFTVTCLACGEEVEMEIPEGELQIRAGDMDVSV